MKFKKFLFNFVTFGMLIYTLISVVYSVLPDQYQLEQFNTLTALVSGGSTGLIGSAGILIKNMLAKNEKAVDTKQTETLEKFVGVLEYVKALENKVASLESQLHEQYVEQANKVNRVIALVEVDLKAKLSNKLIDKETKELINGVLEDEKEVV